jgi:hypothetical protein
VALQVPMQQRRPLPRHLWAMLALAHGARTFLPSLALIALAVAFVLAFVLGVLPAVLAAAAGAVQ